MAARLSCERWGSVNHNARMTSRFTALLVWAAVGALAVFWGLRLGADASLAPKAAAVGWSPPPAAGGLSRLLGAAPAQPQAAAAPPASSRFQLIGVVAPVLRAGEATSGFGAALIATDGKPPRAYRVGAVLEGDWVLQSIGPKSVSVAPAAGGAAFELQVPPLPPPTTGVLPPPDGVPSSPPANPPVLDYQASQIPQVPGSNLTVTRVNAD